CARPVGLRRRYAMDYW
nr:immunoglobulin heavy chain junction region [Mus musculus]